MNPRTTSRWTVEKSAELYGIRRWGAGFFDMDESGDVTVKVKFPSGEVAVSLMEIAQGIAQRDHAMPVLLRIENLLDARIIFLNETFREAIAEKGYQGEYRGVFPVKVNQQSHVIEEITRFGARYGHGLEAGSKAELVLAMASLQPGALLICNGYKDEEFIDLGLRATRLGYRCFFVIESPAELDIVIARSRALGVRPLIGARAKVYAKVGGQWTESSGDRSSFGLSSTQLIEVFDKLNDLGMIDCLQLLHCHLGSQIPNLADIRAGVLEACRYYAALVKEGAPMGYLDFGGGLAVDYLGLQSATHPHSRNYDLADYCRAIIDVIRATLDVQGIKHPHIVTESGRATVAFSSVLMFNILDVMHFEAVSLPETLPEKSHKRLRHLFDLCEDIEDHNLADRYTEALAIRGQIRDLFRQGHISLRERSLSENIFLALAQAIAARIDGLDEIPAGLEGLRQSLSDIYYGNFSVFQSLPDTWAINQIFPIVPLHRNGEAPTREAIIADLTCDSDGKVDTFITGRGVRPTLPLHAVNPDEEYLLGVFLVGAYQETLGDLHNLFGDTNIVSVRINEDGSYDVMKEIEGDSIADVLSYVEYNPQVLFENFRAIAEVAVREKRIRVEERKQILNEFSASLQGYTYFEK
ncbi:MAG: biosynthetic arginine decarboxylase [Trichloromonas sp.]|jgi:arginine decarboxylase|nr:biosynthetic arginine decarboxylase [Trichloromonas sp.]